MEESSKIDVSICVITYNQEAYILDTLKGIFDQKGNFNTELIISDDCSTDNTLSTINIFLKEETKPNIKVEVISHHKNQGATRNFFKTLNRASGEYIAICEGDDYWIDSTKLIKQIEILEKNADCSFCFHKAKVLKNGQFEQVTYPTFFFKERLNVNDFFLLDSIPTCSVFFRKTNLRSFKKIKNSHGDFLLFCKLLELGKAYYLNEVMAVYRKHLGGISFHFSSEKYLNNRITELKGEVKFFENDQILKQINISRMRLKYKFFKNFGKNQTFKMRFILILDLLTNKYFISYYFKNKFNL
ncbi:glycosyltransferase [Cyclobacterium jeungdonense]|uniref:Glycosyltransferase n=1 Tax=Cyclobacterium jeungdonense TaxID=708087 RepID=A0ABT8CDM7_9BACT|nr:glycosyltransferase [Cyclobacterium jeungdonense]MDN3690581.1 glycosyltransferase [Cyclobacterium jeungdonense]